MAVLTLMTMTLRAGAADFSSSANGTSAAQFLTLGADARAAAMGGAYSAVTDDASAIYYNPAGLTRIEDNAFNFMDLVGLADTFLDNAAYGYRLDPRNAAGLSVMYMNYGSIPETDTSGAPLGTAHPYDLAATAAFSHQFDDAGELLNGGSLGLSVSYIESQIVDSANTVTGTLGFLSRPYGDDRLRLSFVAADLFGGLKYDQVSDPLPTTLKLGGSLYPVSWLLASAELDLPAAAAPYFALGLEHWFGDPYETGLALRAGLNTNTLGTLGGLSGFSAGIGLAFSSIRLDYAFVPFGDLGLTNQVSLSLRFGEGGEPFRPLSARLPPSERLRAGPSEADHLSLAESYAASGQYTQAIPEYRLAVAAAPLDPVAHLELAKTLMEVSDWPAAASEWTAADALLPKGDPQRAYCTERLGAVEVRLGNLAKAKAYYVRALEFAKARRLSDTSVVNAYLGLAYCLAEENQKTDAVRNYEKALRLTTNPQTRTAIAKRVQELLGRLKADDDGK